VESQRDIEERTRITPWLSLLPGERYVPDRAVPECEVIRPLHVALDLGERIDCIAAMEDAPIVLAEEARSLGADAVIAYGYDFDFASRKIHATGLAVKLVSASGRQAELAP
jgi:hypothetical protein